MKKTQVKTESITTLSIAAINKAEQVLTNVPKVLEDFGKIKLEVESIKADLNLGLAKYEAEINEKKSTLDESLKAKEDATKEAIKINDNYLKEATSNLNKELEEKKYQHKIAIDREDLNTANTIANKKGLGLFDLNIETKHQTEIDAIEKKNKADLTIAVSSAIKNTKEELNETIRTKDTQITILNNDLKNAKDKVTTLQEEISYLKLQLDAARKQTVDALAAAKVSVTQSNQGK